MVGSATGLHALGVLGPQFANLMTHILSTYLINPARNIRMVRNDSQLTFQDKREIEQLVQASSLTTIHCPVLCKL